MKLSIETYVARQHLGVYEGIKAIKDAGFDAFDFSYYGLSEDESNEIIGEGYIEYVKKLKSYIDEIEIVCNQAHAPFDFKYGMKMDETEPTYTGIVHSIESAAILGAENIVVHAIGDAPEDEFEEYNLKFYRSLAPYAEKFGIHIAVENLFKWSHENGPYPRILGTPTELSNFIKKLDSEVFTACIDVGHAAITETEPEDFISGMSRGVVKALHIQDSNYITDCHTIPYLGRINWDNVAEALKNKEYDGDLTLEVLGFLGRFPKELFPDALKLAERTGRAIIAKIEK